MSLFLMTPGLAGVSSSANQRQRLHDVSSRTSQNRSKSPGISATLHHEGSSNREPLLRLSDRSMMGLRSGTSHYGRWSAYGGDCA
jgi:hypothetical protein